MRSRRATASMLRVEESNISMIEVHTGICGDHLGGKNLALKIVRQGLFWPTIRSDCENFVRNWGIDTVAPFPKSKNQAQYIVVAVDYATKWIEARPLEKIREKEMIEFLTEYIMFRFGVPRIIVEVSNRIILQGLKKRVDELPRPWVDELPNVLWSYRTTPGSSTGISPFKMAFGLEAVSPVEVSLNSSRVEYFDAEASREEIQLHNVLMEEVGDEALKRVLQQQARTTAYFNKKVKVK
ncbi:uncharacterized protein LOC141665582 [Apium graveolens]|uniref:uncharacterized protein LOC141665582 n=1 Tax=Apium graveolens TaxID=4045 RepID=UPI003D7AE6CE